MRLWYKAGYANSYSNAPTACNLLVLSSYLLRQLGNPHNILVSFCRQSHHKIQLYLLPALTESRLCSSHKVFLSNTLVDNIPQSLSTSLWCKGKTTLAHLLHFVSQINGKAIYTQRWQRKAYFFILEITKQIIYQLSQAGIIRRAKRSQRHFVVASRINQLTSQITQLILASLPYWTIGSTGLTEATASGTATEQL